MLLTISDICEELCIIECKLMKLKIIFYPFFLFSKAVGLSFAQWPIELDGELRVYLCPFLFSLSWWAWFRKAGSLIYLFRGQESQQS